MPWNVSELRQFLMVLPSNMLIFTDQELPELLRNDVVVSVLKWGMKNFNSIHSSKNGLIKKNLLRDF